MYILYVRVWVCMCVNIFRGNPEQCVFVCSLYVFVRVVDNGPRHRACLHNTHMSLFMMTDVWEQNEGDKNSNLICRTEEKKLARRWMSRLTALSLITAITKVHQWNNNSANISITETNCNVNNVHSPLEWSSNYLYIRLFLFFCFCSFHFIHALVGTFFSDCIAFRVYENAKKKKKKDELCIIVLVLRCCSYTDGKWWKRAQPSFAINDHAQTFDFPCRLTLHNILYECKCDMGVLHSILLLLWFAN